MKIIITIIIKVNRQGRRIEKLKYSILISPNNLLRSNKHNKYKTVNN